MTEEIWRKKTETIDQIKGTYRFNDRLPFSYRQNSGKPNHKLNLPVQFRVVDKIPDINQLTQPRKQGQPDYLLSRENYMKMKRAGASIPGFAHDADHPGPRVSPYKTDNLYLRPEMDPNSSNKPKTTRVEQL